MSCEIINPELVSLNGSNSAYGGSIQSVSFNIGGLNGGHRASISLASKNSMSTPTKNDEFTLSILGMNLDMKVGGYRVSTSVSSPPILTLDLYDKSNEYLDKKFIQLKEEYPEPAGGSVDILGRKMGPLPDKELTESSNSLSPNRDTVWGDIRNFFKELKSSKSFFGGGGRLLTDSDVDYYTQDTAGKTIWYVNSDPNDGVTLKDALGDLLAGDDLPNGPFDFTGTYRDVIVQLCAAVGSFAYWDAEKNKVVITSNFNMGAGQSKMSGISRSCSVTSTTSASNFTVSRSQGAHGSIDSGYPGESFSVFGPKMTKYLKGKLLEPAFHYKKCGSTKGLEELKDQEGLDKAVAASQNPEVFSMLAIQAILKHQTSANIPAKGLAINLKGAGNAKRKITTQLSEQFDVDNEGPEVFSANKFLSEYYVNEGEALCSGGKTFPVSPSALSSVEKEFNRRAKNWNEAADQPPVSIVGKWNIGSNSFDNGVLMLKEDNTLLSLIDDDGNLSSEADILRKYLNALSKFTGRFYVVPETTGLRTIKGNSFDYDYGYYMITDHSSPSSNFNVPEGYELATIYPFEPVSKCSIAELSDLAKVCAMMYKGDGCFDGFLDQIPVVEFIRAMDKNQLKPLFQNPNGYMRGRADETSKFNDKNWSRPSIQMFLVIKKGSDIDGFEDSRTVCFSDGMEITAVAQNPTKKISKLASKLSFGKDTFTGQITDAGYKLLAIAKEDISSTITGQSIMNGSSSSRVKLWYDVDQSQASIKTSIGNFFMSEAKLADVSDDIWSSSIRGDVSINAADVGLNNELFGEYQASAANQSDAYSAENRAKMKAALSEKIGNNVWSDSSPSNSSSISFIATDSDVGIPSISEGLESLNITQRGSLLEVQISVGDSNIRAAKMAMLSLRANNSRLRHGYSTHIPDTFSSISNQRLVSLGKGIIK